MRNKLLIFIVLLVSASVSAVAQQLEVNAPGTVEAKQRFMLTYDISIANGNNVESFQLGKIPDSFKQLADVQQVYASGSSTVNNHTTSYSIIRFNVLLSSTDATGSFSIPPAKVKVDGKWVSSAPARIKVIGQHQKLQERQAGSQVSGSDLFFKVSANKRQIHEQEPVLLTYTLYTRVQILLNNIQFSQQDISNAQLIDVPVQDYVLPDERVNGNIYRRFLVKKVLVYPQKTGTLVIPEWSCTVPVYMALPDVDPFDALFNGGSGYTTVNKRLTAPALNINVQALPAKPADFSGGVGQFHLSAQLDKSSVKANDPLTLHVVVSGQGNLKLIKEPVVEFPKDFDRYDAKSTEKTKVSESGVEGSVTYEYLAVPRHEGEYEIPPVRFTYFDTSTGRYNTLTTKPVKVSVAKGSGSGAAAVNDYTSSKDVKLINNDIRFIKSGGDSQRSVGDFFYGSTAYWVALSILVLTFISLFVIFRQRAINNADIVKTRGRRANKVATKRLKKAHGLMLSGQSGAFYDEVLRALWGYVGDKLSIQVEKLSRDNISERLAERQVSDDIIAQFISALDECEFQRYAPGDPKGNMRKVYEKAITGIERIEDTMKKQKSRIPLTALLAAVLLMAPLGSRAAVEAGPTGDGSSSVVTKAAGDSAYVNDQYEQAISIYEQLLRQGDSPELYYNLGNAYFRNDNLTRAILNYERALLLSPGDGDIRFNLQIARSRTIDKIVPQSQMFFVTWYQSLVNVMSVDSWAWTALLALAVAVVLSLVYLFAGRLWLRKVGFFGAVLFVSLFVVCNVFAHQQKRTLTIRNTAIIVSPQVSIKSTPAANGTELFLLHEGTKATIIDNSMKNWKEIRIADGKQGWVETSQLEVI